MSCNHTTIPRYPYLLTPQPTLGTYHSHETPPLILHHIPYNDQPSTYNSAAWTEDIEMGWDGEYDETAHLLAIDTNILISHLPLVQAMYKLLDPLVTSPLILLIPSVVLSELDGLKTSMRCSDIPNITLGECARAATTWMLNVNRARRESGRTKGGVLRGQRWVERLHQDRTKGDDRILDCCLYFRSPPSDTIAGVTLWTNDRNLSVLAENEDIATIGSRKLTIAGIINATGIELPEDAWRRVPGLHASLTAGEETHSQHKDDSRDNDDMELDEDFMAEVDEADQHQQTSNLSSRTGSSSSVYDTTTSNLVNKQVIPVRPSTVNNTNTLRPTFADIQQFRHSINVNLTPIISTIIANPAFDIAHNDLEPARQLLKMFEHLEAVISRSPSTHENDTYFGITPERQSLLRAISSIRTIATFLEPGGGKRRPRTGEVADAVEVLGKMLADLGLPNGLLRDFGGLAERARRM